MNLLKIQQDLLKVIFKEEPEKVRFFHDDLFDRTFVMPNNHIGYLIPDEDLRVSLEGAQMVDPSVINLEGIVADGVTLIGTDEYRGGGDLRKYMKQTSDRAVYVDKTKLKNFDPSAVLVQLSDSPFYPVAVLEDKYNDGDLTIVGMVMPCKVKETEEAEA